MRLAKLTGEVAEQVIAWSPTLTNTQIVDKLKEEYGITISNEGVRKFLKSIREERAEQTKALVQDTIKATVPRDLEILDEGIKQLREWFKSCKEDKDAEDIPINTKLQVWKELRETITTKLKHSGASEEEKDKTLTIKWDDDE
jgi:ribosomal protein S15P/S13E